MKAVMLSIQPRWCSLIANGKKTVEIRKTKPTTETPFKCYIYCTKSNEKLWILNKKIFPRLKGDIAQILNAKDVGGASKANSNVIGEFVCDAIISHCEMANADIAEQQGRIRREALVGYSNGKQLYGWHISDLVIYDEPKDLGEFSIKKPPQSWCYVKEREDNGQS